MPPFPELRRPLTGEAVRLRLAAERDIPEILIAHQDDPGLSARLGLRRPPSGAELGRRVEGQPSERAAGSAVWLTIVTPESDDCRGQLDAHDVDWDHGRADLTIWIAPGHRGHGLAAEALRLAGRWLLADCGLERLQLITGADNAPMRAAAQAAGWSEEGRLRGYVRERGRRVDVVMLSLVAADVVAA